MKKLDNNSDVSTKLHMNKISYLYKDMEMQYDIEVKGGNTLALIGPSGGGKTTFLNLIAGFLSPSSGEVIFENKTLTALAPSHRPVTMLFQEHNLFPHLSVQNNIAIGINPNLKLSATEQSKIENALNDVGLSGMEDRLPKALSGGQRQRVALARALVRDKPLLLMDEPFSALDPGRKKSMISLLKNLQQHHHMTLIFSTHDPRDALDFADQLAFIGDGKIKEAGTPEALIKGQQSDHVKDYLGI